MFDYYDYLRKGSDDSSGIYILSDKSGRYLVGQSADVIREMWEITMERGSNFLSAGGMFPVCPETSGSSKDLDKWERNETLKLMKRHGIKKVRGWIYKDPVLSKEQEEDAWRQICAKFKLCMHCGKSGTHECFLMM
jgi:hypothetical protein